MGYHLLGYHSENKSLYCINDLPSLEILSIEFDYERLLLDAQLQNMIFNAA